MIFIDLRSPILDFLINFLLLSLSLIQNLTLLLLNQIKFIPFSFKYVGNHHHGHQCYYLILHHILKGKFPYMPGTF